MASCSEEHQTIKFTMNEILSRLVTIETILAERCSLRGGIIAEDHARIDKLEKLMHTFKGGIILCASLGGIVASLVSKFLINAG